ncbi:MAG TPA: beta-ketoacyl-[acyl-carrier-protein] synthase family protein [Desulfomonilia bacterium]
MPRAFVTGLGLISPAGSNADEHLISLSANKTFIKKLTLFNFEAAENAPPAGEIAFPVNESPGLPRTHTLALMAAREAMKNSGPPDAVVIGSTTGGMPLSEELLKDKIRNPSAYKYHGTGTVAEYLAHELGCNGPAFTVSTACSSGALALKAALEMIRAGIARKILAGGVDALCRLTCYGFYTLQLIDPTGARPLDKNRLGMTVGEGAGMLLLEAADISPANAIAELKGGGLSCDAYHATKPHPEGEGAIAAMNACLRDAGVKPEEVSYINLHGTGTPDNDAAEAKAVLNVFGETPPLLSSTKGLAGHPLAAAGAIEAGYACLAVKHDFIPPNTGLDRIDETLGIVPVSDTLDTRVDTVLSNSFGFGGNNASLIISKPAETGMIREKKIRSLKVKGFSMITGAGHTAEIMTALEEGKPCAGRLDIDSIAKDLPPRLVRRLGRLSQIVLALCDSAYKAGGSSEKPEAVFFGTGWGALSETSDFLSKIFETGGKYGSPTDFVGSVHNAPAGQAALFFSAKGANVTATSGDSSFEQALFMAQLLNETGRQSLLIGADEFHEEMTPLLDASSGISLDNADGGAAFLVSGGAALAGPSLTLLFYERNSREHLKGLIEKLKSIGINERFAAIFAGIPSNEKQNAESQIEEVITGTTFQGAVFDYRKFFGQFATSSAVAAAYALACLEKGTLPFIVSGGQSELASRGILLLGLGSVLSAIEINP